MNTYQCRRKKTIEVNDYRESIKNAVVIDSQNNFSLFLGCLKCGYGHKSFILKSREPPFETYEIKTCTLRKTGGEVSAEEVEKCTQ